ncbi:Maf-domain-containing protein [Aspergillus heteromorphus CBS 117.55]|uniref:Maf-domain-containing protein n=1 Tax=Aspergillus heteromorphus CBS 117.55 TaxID=1448321 RepID=A0A317WZ93_9EURO|nr:Maf-domain-containing protein [Aspergillus heteromorphus CBS 117.55]PWY90058.1 Maf-domain-containing protein [Aspergillus heteromorphus CBS 117.55]
MIISALPYESQQLQSLAAHPYIIPDEPTMPSARPPASLASSSSEPSYSPVATGAPNHPDDRDDRSPSNTPTGNSSSKPVSGSSASNAQDKEKPRLTEQEKKNNHIASEQKRRAAIREGFDRLTELVPGLEGQGRSESIVLRKTVDFIQLQLQERQELIAEIERRGGCIDKCGINDIKLSTSYDCRNRDGILDGREKSGALLSQNNDPSDPPPAYDQTTTAPAPNPKRSTMLLPRPPPLSLPILNNLRNKRFILASASPRRRQILSLLGLPNVEVIPSNTPEDLPKTMEPFEYVLATATLKAQAVYAQEINNEEKGEPAIILAADTVVVDTGSGTILEKPRSEAQHIAMLKGLRDAGDHRVYTAMVAMAPLASARQPGYALETALEETDVRFDRNVTDELILAYVRTREGADKAGGYGLQGLGSILVERISGSWDNVVGLPLRATLNLIERVAEKADDEDLLDGEGEEFEEGSEEGDE